MKKFITLVLVLVLALGLSVPAMAFTSDTSEDVDHPYDLKIYLVEYDDNDLFGLVSMPESDRGYAKNEIVAAVIELDIPDGEDPYADGYRRLAIEGENVRFDVMDNKAPLECTEGTEVGVGNFSTSLAGAEDGGYFPLLENGSTGKGLLKDDTTHKVLFFAKVTGDEASITVKLIDGTPAADFDGTTMFITLDGDDYLIVKNTSATADGYYTIYCNYVDAGTDTYKHAIRIYVDEDHVSTGMAIKYDATSGNYTGDLANTAFTPLGVNTKNELGIVKNAIVDIDGDDFDDIMDVYNDYVVDVFGMDYFKIGNYVRDSFFEDLVSSDTITATVDIAPWTAYVTVPDNIVVDPPKTGDAASIMGFVMVALSGAGVVALRKRG